MFDFEFFKSKASFLLGGLLVLILIFLLVGFLFPNRFPSAYQLRWQSALAVLDRELLTEIIQENSSKIPTESSLDPKVVKVLEIPSERGKLYIVDFNTPQMCGIGGCLYGVYTLKKEKLLELLLIPGLPSGQELFSLLDRQRNGIPCLSVAQLNQSGKIFHTEFCYEGIRFVKVNQVFESGD